MSAALLGEAPAAFAAAAAAASVDSAVAVADGTVAANEMDELDIAELERSDTLSSSFALFLCQL